MPVARLSRDEAAVMVAESAVSRGVPAGMSILTTIPALCRPPTGPTSGIESPLVSASGVTPSALNRRTVQACCDDAVTLIVSATPARFRTVIAFEEVPPGESEL